MHIPVLQKEVIQYLNPGPNENFIDATISEGGHSLAIIERILPNGRVLGIDWSPELIQQLQIKNQKSKIKNNFILICENFANLSEIVRKTKFDRVWGILFDLGMSSWHLEESGRGFSFQKREPLDMRYSPQSPLTAEKIVNFWSKFDLERILKEYGEERFARQIAEKIVEERKVKAIHHTLQLVEIVRKAVPGRYWRQKIHPATRTFQALRIAVNDELVNLEKALPQSLDILKPGGKIAVISFHSLEDRIVKNFFREQFLVNNLKILTKKPITPSSQEIKINKRARSAKLRLAQKI